MAQAFLPGRTTVVPSAGVVVAWRVKTPSGTTGQVSLYQLRPAPDGGYTGLGLIDSGQLSGAGGVQTFRLAGSSHRLEAGDVLALRVARDAPPVIAAETPGASVDVWDTSISIGAIPPPAATVSDVELLFNADIEPDVDGDGHGDETQDLCPEYAGTAGNCPVTLKINNAVEPLHVQPGGQGTTTLTITNTGAYPARNVTLQWAIRGDGFALPSLLSSTDAACGPDIVAGPVVTAGAPTERACNLSPFAPGEARTLTAVVRFPNPVRGLDATIARVTSQATYNDGRGDFLGRAFWLVAFPDRKPPTLSVRKRSQRIRDAIKRGLRLRVAAGETSSGRLRALLIRPHKRKLTAGSKSWHTKGTSTATVTIKLGRAARALVGRAGRRVIFEVTATGKDTAGNTAKRTTVRITVRR